MATKSFSSLAVAGTYSAFVLEQGGMAGIHEVMDHLFPGIMTLGVAAMQPTAAAYLAKQVPALADLGTVHDGGWEAYARRVTEALGETVEIDGPLSVSDAEVSAALDALGKRTQERA